MIAIMFWCFSGPSSRAYPWRSPAFLFGEEPLNRWASAGGLSLFLGYLLVASGPATRGRAQPASRAVHSWQRATATPLWPQSESTLALDYSGEGRNEQTTDRKAGRE